MSIDPAALEPYHQLGSSFVVELIDTFLNSTQAIVDALYTSISTKDATLFTRSAHTLKSNGAVFGAKVFSSLALELETVGKTAELSTLLPKVDQLKAEHQQVCRELVDLRRSLNP
jgi:HPt (histidine-containing phosphotransfer) domain-containing protein